MIFDPPDLADTQPRTTRLQDALSVAFGFAVGLALGAWVTSGISPGHINPAVTIAMATFRRDFPWWKVPAYIFVQVMGGLCGAGIVYANYIHAIDLVEGGRHVRTVPGTASLFGTYAVRSSLARLFTQLVAERFSESGFLLAAVHDSGVGVVRRGGMMRASLSANI